jgi:hypothetical protein
MMEQFKRGMNLAEAAERIGPILGLPPEQLAGFVIIAVVDDDNSGPAIAASENITPVMAAEMLTLTGGMLAANLAADALNRRELN